MNSPPRIPAERIEALFERLLDGRGGGSQPDLSARIADGGADCPDDREWQRVASRSAHTEESRLLIEHAAGCQRCGAILSFWASILSEEQTPEETASLGTLSALTPGWQERMTKTLAAANAAAKAGVSGGAGSWLPFLAIAGSVAAVALIFLFIGYTRSQASPERLLAVAYSGHRIMEARIPLAEFAPVDPARHSRGAAGAGLSDSVPLLEARAAITQALMKTPEDPHWLLLQARSDLLNENYNSAIDTLKRLHAGDPTNEAVLTDLASAYMMRSKATDAESDEASALDYLEQAARQDPKNPVVLYNEAVVLQDIFQYANAIDVWKRFLAVEHDRAWIADGKRHLAEIEAQEAKVKAQQSRLDFFLASPEGMLHLARSPAVLAEYDEQLSTVSLPLLLKTAFPLPSGSDPPRSDFTTQSEACAQACAAARTLLHALAASLKAHHHDLWLTDLLTGPVTPDFESAANKLADAVADGMFANPAHALEEATSAQVEFAHSGNPAGDAKARSEQIFDIEHLQDARGCLAAASRMPALLAHRSYLWIEAQYQADEAGCQVLQNDFAAGTAAFHRSLRMSEEAGYRSVDLRTSGFAAENEETIGNRDLAWEMNIRALRTYWDGNYPVIRRLLPYANLASIEQGSTRLYSAVALRREAFREAAFSSNPRLVSENHFWLVKAEIRAGEMQEASRDLNLAQAELAALPDHNLLHRIVADNGILLAEAYLGRGDAADAAAMLRGAAANFDGAGTRDMEFRYASAVGHLALLEGNTHEAEVELTHSVNLAESGYRETRSEQDRMDWMEGARRIYAGLTLARLREGRSPLDALAIWERYRVLSSGVSLQPLCHGGDLDCLAQPLDAARQSMHGETVLGTIRFDRSLLLWTMDDRGIRFREVKIDPERFDLLGQSFFETLATPASSEDSIRFYGRPLGSALLEPMASALDPHRVLIFDLDDSMEFLPVAALPFQGKYLGLQFAISTVHSVLLADRRTAHGDSSRQSLVVGASDPEDPETPRLPEAKTEALTVAAFLAAPKVFVGSDATAQSVERAAPHTALIHFAGHTSQVAGGTRLLLARPAKSGPDWLDARAFQSRAFANCRLVVLSACSTGKREERAFDDIQDIVQTLTAEGAQQIVATHWDVDSAASVLLMKAFYSGLAQGLAVPQALLRAEDAVSATATYEHPYYWAPYYVTGMGNSSLKELLHDD